jgi:hypothetical protein
LHGCEGGFTKALLQGAYAGGKTKTRPNPIPAESKKIHGEAEMRNSEDEVGERVEKLHCDNEDSKSRDPRVDRATPFNLPIF